MKKLILSAAAVASLTAANAQTGLMVFGNAGYNVTKQDKMSMSNWNVNPGVGYQLNKNWTIGLEGNYGADSAYKFENTKMSYRNYSVGVFGRYTMPLGNIFFLYGQAGAGYKNEHASSDGKKVDGSDVNGFYVKATPAVGAHIAKGFSLTFDFGGINYSSMKEDVSGAVATNNFGINLGQTMHIGVMMNFGQCKGKCHSEPMAETRRIDTSDDTAPKASKASKDDDE